MAKRNQMVACYMWPTGTGPEVIAKNVHAVDEVILVALQRKLTLVQPLQNRLISAERP